MKSKKSVGICAYIVAQGIVKWITYLVGASSVSMSPLMKVARFRVLSLMASCSLEMFNLANSSSRTLTEPLFSFDAMFADVDVVAGMLVRKEGGETRGKKIRAKSFLASVWR